jgi:hypothetical protein
MPAIHKAFGDQRPHLRRSDLYLPGVLGLSDLYLPGVLGLEGT